MTSNIWDLTPPSAYAQSQAAPQPQAQDPWFNGGQYGQSQDWFNTPISQAIQEQNQRLAFGAYGSRQGIANTDNTFNRWFYETQYPKFQQGYGQATLYNPMMTIKDYIATLPNMQALQQQFNAGTPSSRGAQYNTFAPNVRWVPR